MASAGPGRSIRVLERDGFFDDSFFKEAWDDFDRAMQSVLDRFDSTGLKVDVGSRNHCRDVYTKIRSSKIDEDLYSSQALQITEKDGKFQVVMDVKDFNPRELQVRAVDDRIVVEGSYQKMSEDGASSSCKSFYKEFTLPSAADIDHVSTALSKDGVLTIKAPKKDGAAITDTPRASNTSSSTSSSVQQSYSDNGSSSTSFKSTSSRKVIQSSSSFESSSTDGFDALPKEMREKLMFCDSGFGSTKTSTCSSPAPSEAGSESSRVSSTMEFDLSKRHPVKTEVAFNVSKPSQGPVVPQQGVPQQGVPHQGVPLQSQPPQSPPQFPQQPSQPPQPQQQIPPHIFQQMPPQFQQMTPQQFQQFQQFQQSQQASQYQSPPPQFAQSPPPQFVQSPPPQFAQSPPPQPQYPQQPQYQSPQPQYQSQQPQYQSPQPQYQSPQPQFQPPQPQFQPPQPQFQQQYSQCVPQPLSQPATGTGNQTSISITEENGKRVLTSQTSNVVQEKDGFKEHKETTAEITDKDSQAARKEATTKLSKVEEDPEGKFKRAESTDAEEVSESCIQHLPDGSVMSVKKNSTSSSSVKQSFSTHTGGDMGSFFPPPNFPQGFDDFRNLMGRGHSLMSQRSTDSMGSTLSGRSGFSDMSSFSQFTDGSSPFSDMSNFSNMPSTFSSRSRNFQQQQQPQQQQPGMMPQDFGSPRMKTFSTSSSSSTSSFNQSFSSNFGDGNF